MLNVYLLNANGIRESISVCISATNNGKAKFSLTEFESSHFVSFQNNKALSLL